MTLPIIEIRHNCQPSANGFLAKFLRKMSNEPYCHTILKKKMEVALR